LNLLLVIKLDPALQLRVSSGAKMIMGKAFSTAILLIAFTFALTPIISAGRCIDTTWVLMSGSVKKYGDESPGGWCNVFAEVDSWAEVHAFWVKPQILPIPGIYVFHYARLATASMVKLNYEEKDFYILGTWDAFKVTIVYRDRDDTSRIVEPIAEGARGEFFVTGNWKDFSISIDSPNVKPISGTVVFHRITIRGPIPRGDVRGFSTQTPDGRIDVVDLFFIARAYGSVPGMSRYDFSLDLNFDFMIDINDLQILAANCGREY